MTTKPKSSKARGIGRVKTVSGWIIMRGDLPQYPFPTKAHAEEALKRFVETTFIAEIRLPKSAGFK